jgi:uncharacterized membrane protein
MIRPDVFYAIFVLGITTYVLRAGGFFMMRYVAITPRVEAWLRSIPIALIGAILGPIAVNGGPPEWLGIVVAVGLMYTLGNEFVSAMLACGAVALVRLAMA